MDVENRFGAACFQSSAEPPVQGHEQTAQETDSGYFGAFSLTMTELRVDKRGPACDTFTDLAFHFIDLISLHPSPWKWPFGQFNSPSIHHVMI